MNLNKEIRDHYKSTKRKRVRKEIIPGNWRSLWRAVNIAKDLNQEDLPMQMNEDGIPITDNDLPDRFADYFEEKVMNLASNVAINPTVLIINRMTCINRSIKYDWLNLSLIGYKLKVKELFLT